MAPVSAKERMKKYRERIKADPTKLKEHLDKEKKRDQMRRNKFKNIVCNDKVKKDEELKKVRDRVRLHRQRKKAQVKSETNGLGTESPLGSYRCPQSFGKALSRVKKFLPKSPTKKAAVVKKLAMEIVGSNLFTVVSKPNKKSPNIISDEDKVSVTQFFCSDEISRQAPGKQDVKSVKDPVTGKRIHMQKRHMVMTVGEAYQEFKSNNPDIHIGKSSFYALRPEYVLPVSQMPHTVCVCEQHGNFNNLVEAISTFTKSFPKNHAELLPKLCCGTSNEDCMMGRCQDCPGLITALNNLVSPDIDQSKEINWKEWDKDESGYPKIFIRTGSCKNAVIKLTEMTPKFKTHCYVKKAQAQYFETCKKDLTHEEAVVQIDFAENYAMISQDEIQSAHWSHSQITIFTCGVWLSEGVFKAYVVVSDDLSHDKYSVWAFLDVVIAEIKQIAPSVSHLFIFSDNAASQFKNRYVLSNICLVEHDYNGISVEWNFFASSHGKGVVDGIGGNVKRCVWVGVKSRRFSIDSASDFHDVVVRHMKNIKSFFVNKEKTREKERVLKGVWENVKAIPNIRACHHFRSYDHKSILASVTSLSEMNRIEIRRDEVNEESATSEPSDNEENDTSQVIWSKKSREFRGSSEECLTSYVQETAKTLNYSDVYTDSEDETDSLVSPLHKEDVGVGVFVMVGIKSEKKNKDYRYVGICQGLVDENSDVQILFLKSCGEKTFKPNESDESTVRFDQLIGKLPTPVMKLRGQCRVVYEFSSRVNVREA